MRTGILSLRVTPGRILAGHEGANVLTNRSTGARRLWGTPAAILVLGGGLFGLTACGSDDNSGSGSAAGTGVQQGDIPCPPGDSGGTGSITGAGSTFQKNIELQWIKDYGAACPGAQVQY